MIMILILFKELLNRLLSSIRIPVLLILLMGLMISVLLIKSNNKSHKIESLEASIKQAKEYSGLIHMRDSIIILKIQYEIDSVKNASWIYMGNVNRMSNRDLQSELSRRFEK